MTHHWLIEIYVPGCLPDYQSLHITKGDALKELRDLKHEFQDSGRTVSGRLSDGLLLVDPNVRVSLTRVDEPMLDLDLST